MPSVKRINPATKLLDGAGATSDGNAAEPFDLPHRKIEAIDIVKEFHTELGTRRVLNGVSFSVGKGERMAILGRNGAGKSTLIQILSGLQRPTSGRIERGLRMSWPLALGCEFDGELTGQHNIAFIAHVYSPPFKDTYASISP